MKRTLIIIFLLLAVAMPAMADNWHAIIYCPEKTPQKVGDALEHWKDKMPNLGANVTLWDFWKLGSQGGKTVWYALIDDSAAGRIRNYIDANPALGIKYWYGRSARAAWADVYKDRGSDSVARAIVGKLMKYPVPTQITDELGTRTVDVPKTLDEATAAGVTINAQTLTDYPQAIPMEVWNGSN